MRSPLKILFETYETHSHRIDKSYIEEQIFSEGSCQSYFSPQKPLNERQIFIFIFIGKSIFSPRDHHIFVLFYFTFNRLILLIYFYFLFSIYFSLSIIINYCIWSLLIKINNLSILFKKKHMNHIYFFFINLFIII